MRKSFFLFLLILLSSIPGFSQPSIKTLATNEGYQMQIELKTVKNTVMLDEPAVIIFEIRTPQNLCPPINDFLTNIGKPERYQITITRDEDKTVLPFMVKASRSGLSGCYSDVAAESRYYRKVVLPSPQAFEKVGNYTITLKQEIETANSLSKIKNSLTVEVSASIKVIPTDDRKLGELIETFGEKMLALDEDAAMFFPAIKDKRTIKYHLRFLEKNKEIESPFRYDFTLMKMRTIWSLSFYNDDSAFEAIRNMMSSPNERVRDAVAGALFSSPHPKALSLLLSMQNDEEAAVRLLVVHGLGKIKTDETTARLREMLKDADEKVKANAQEYLDKRGQK